MDINRLLSPDESPAPSAPVASPPSSAVNNPMPSPRKARRPTGGNKRTSSALSRELTLSPDGVSGQHPRSAVRNNHAPRFMPQQQPPPPPPPQAYNPAQQPAVAVANFRPLHAPAAVAGVDVQNSYGYVQAPPQRPVIPHRGSSTASNRSTVQMETLADAASMQRQPLPRNDSNSTVHTNYTAESQRSPSLVNQTVTSAANAPPISRAISGQSLADLTMAEAPSQTPPPRAFTSNALTETESQAVTDLLQFLSENSYAYDSHVQLVSLLHKGFLTHVYPVEGSDEPAKDPRHYGLLVEMRQAREAMDSRFAVGEALWLDWLADELMLAQSSDERIALMELFQKATQDEPASIALWQAYADWVEVSHAACNDLPNSNQAGWTAEDKEVCRELFTPELLEQVLEQAIAATQWRVDQGHLLWNRFIAAKRQAMGANPSRTDLERLQNLFVERLRIPSAGWDEVAQQFWPLITQLHGSEWEAAMAQMNELAEPAKVAMGLRDEHELKLQRAVDSGNRVEAFEEFTKYLRWDKNQNPKKRSPFDKELRSALFERALVQFPTHTEWWLDYLDFVISQKPSSHDPSSSTLPLIERATRHCPWSGELWAKRILRSDVERMPYHQIEAIKHRATNSGLLDVGGMEEMLKVLMEWCSYLRRNAFTSTSSEDDLDTAEVGITMALEDVQEAGRKVYGKDFQGDPLHRLELIHNKFLSEARRMDEARNIWRSLVQKQKGSFDFWNKYYNWEMLIWGHERLSDNHRIETTETAPHLATKVVDEMLSQRNLDWPEKAIELYMTHFQQHESVERLQAAGIEAREYTKKTAVRRAKEGEEAAALAAQQQQEQAAAAIMEVDEPAAVVTGEKRKRDDEAGDQGDHQKKSKTEDVPPGDGEPSASASAQIKRDRENCTITITNLPTDATELELRKFFRDCGTVKSVGISTGSGEHNTIGTVEFETPEDAAFAKSRNGKDFGGQEIHIRSGSQSTLYVTNYPPSYDETSIRKLFAPHGEIVTVRFPSLKYNNRRRFCYVQFLNDAQAKTASEALDGKAIDGQHRLQAKVSDPDARKARGGAQAEGRELFVKNIEFAATDPEVRAFFSQYGTVVSMNLLKRADGKRLGNGFVVFETPAQASAAVEGADKATFQDRILYVAFSTPRSGAGAEKARKEDIIVKHSASPEPGAVAPNGTGARRGSDVSMRSATPLHPHDEEMAKTVRERKVAIFNLPDTVNDARVRAEMEKHGAIIKIQLRRAQEAAIVEFADIKTAFHVREGVDVRALGEGVRTGNVEELFVKGKERGAGGSGGMAFAPARVARPGQQRGGRRGGLGSKRGAFGGAGPAFGGGGVGSGGEGKEAKSNADFKALFEKSREPKPEDAKPAPTDGGEQAE